MDAYDFEEQHQFGVAFFACRKAYGLTNQYETASWAVYKFKYLCKGIM